MKKNKKFLFYFCGKPVYEGDETHKVLKEAADEGKTLIEKTKEKALDVQKKLDALFPNKLNNS